MNERDPQYILYGFVILGIIVILIPKVIAALMRKPSAAVSPAQQPSLLALPEDQPKCFCGEPAVEPYPLLRRSRSAFGVLRDHLMMPPSYRREVPDEKIAKKELCASHAHLADANVDEFIATSVKSAFVRAYQEVAKEASTFETQGLKERLEASLTDKQKEEIRRREQEKKRLAQMKEQKPAEPKPQEVPAPVAQTTIIPPAPAAEEKTS